MKSFLAAGAMFASIMTSAMAGETAKPERIVSIGGDVTEIIYMLDKGDAIVAVDTTSTTPSEALASKKSVGYMRALSAEGVLSVAPDLVVASEGAGPAEAVRTLKNASVPFVGVPDDDGAEGVPRKILAVGRAIGENERAIKLAADVRAGFERLAEMRAENAKPISTLFILNASGDRFTVGGSGTSADAALRLAGAQNAASGIEGFKPLTAEGLISLAPEAIVVMTGGRGGDDAAALGERPAVKLTPAGRSGRILEMDGSYLVGFGPRAPQAIEELMNWLRSGKGANGKS